MRIIFIMTGGTIAKTYDEADGSLRNARPVVEKIVSRLRIPDLEVTYKPILFKDSLDLTDADRRLILQSTLVSMDEGDGIILVHGTDTLATTGEMLVQNLGQITVPIILTGAMRPYEFRDSDALQNVTEALLACRLAQPGVYVVMHNRVLSFPGVTKDMRNRCFVKSA